MNSGYRTLPEEQQRVKQWVDRLGGPQPAGIELVNWQQGWGKLGLSQSILNAPLCLAGKPYEWGFGTHADSEINLRSTVPVKTFRAVVGIDANHDSGASAAELVFSVWTAGRQVAESPVMKIGAAPYALQADLGGATEFTLKVKTQNTIYLAHADWANPEAVAAAGQTFKLGLPDMPRQTNPLPVSFIYGGTPASDWFRKWGIVHTQHDDDQDFITHRFVTTDRDTGLECDFTLRQYKKFPAVIWNVSFKNTGAKPTPILEQVKVLDWFYQPQGPRPELFRAHGAFHYENEPLRSDGPGEPFRDDFMPVKDELNHAPPIKFGAVGGRPSVDWMPYFNLIDHGGGLLFGIGWTGQWQAEIDTSTELIHLRAGMEFLHTTLQPGEAIRQPAVLTVFWSGADPSRAHNLLRRFMTDEILPRDDGQSIQAPVTYGSWGAMTDAEHLRRIANIKEQKLPYDYYWIDADWYGPDETPDPDPFQSKWAQHVGIWRANQTIHPQGLKPVSDAVHQAGMKFLLWFEPERAVCGVPVTKAHPDWFLDDCGIRTDGNNLLLDLGNPAARQWCIETIAGLIRDYGIDCYRQDFNFSPLPYWRKNDAPDRVGITEIRHIEGLYAFWDELRRRFPHLLIDNCASGGRRLDFEMMRRSIPLWASDMQCYPTFITERNQQQVHGLSLWIPQFSFGTEVRHAGDTYHFRSTMAGGIVAHLFPNDASPINPNYPYQWLRDRLAEYHRAKIYFRGDFYPLLPVSGGFADWSAYQFDRPDLGAGIVEVFRKKDSPIERVRLELQGLDPAAEYELENADTHEKITVAGTRLTTDGWPVEIEQKRDSRLFFYHKKDK